MEGLVILGLTVAVVVVVAAACQILSGVGFALICSPLLMLSLGHHNGVAVALTMSILLNVAVLARSFRDVRIGDAARLFVPAAVLVFPAAWLSGVLAAPAVLLVSGVAILVATGLLAAGRRMRWLKGPSGAITAGVASGVLNVLAAASGPPVALFAAQRRWTPTVTTATLRAFALPLNLLTLTVVGLPTSPTSQLGWAVAGLLVGTFAALPFTHRVSPGVLRIVTLAVAAGGGAFLVIKGLA
ncbi:TSUP family transporter [Curtobacterium sp. MCBD17_003]|uniref:TSUP family transporter n=1 Tax=Curtobacterium sp. MCBD17_003 TaxID=2175667 RepID=UPI0015E8DB1A|nr:TSUP family transporter [Curtobacterium sp. MCBD17_003]WIE54769.1 TSUP family transporter [Curtobacterium sp. MCBD17_003]